MKFVPGSKLPLAFRLVSSNKGSFDSVVVRFASDNLAQDDKNDRYR
ncbi:MAG: hypothetical protein LAP86_09325 [Acidobacteriia bacterium]|nr:hypothetical protein [Terriglobia bacterium]